MTEDDTTRINHIDGDKIEKELGKFFNRKDAWSEFSNFWLMIGSMALAVPRIGAILWMTAWGYQIFQHFRGKSLTQEKVYKEVEEESGDEE